MSGSKIKVKLKLFALYREIVGASELEHEVASGIRVDELLEGLIEKHPGLSKYRDEILISVNKNYAPEDTELREGDEVAIIPPISGG